MLQVPELIKTLYSQDSVKKNFRVEFASGKYPDIINDRIISQSVVFNESLCQKKSIKFGLCEASSIKFTVVGMPNIKDEIIKCGYDIDVTSVKDELEEAEYKQDLGYWSYYLPLGVFFIKSCLKQADMNKRSVVAYSFEKITDFELPKSIQGLRAFTWNTPRNINFSGDNLLDLVFPSYSYSRKMMTTTTPTDWLGTFNFKVGNIEHTCKLKYHRVFIATNDNPEVIFTYKLNYDEKAYSKKLTEAQEYLKNLGYTGKIDWDFVYDSELIGKAFTRCYDSPYSIFRYTTSQEVSSVEAALSNDIVEQQLELDDRPHTLFKIHNWIDKTSTVSIGTGGMIYKSSNHELYGWLLDGGGMICVPGSIEVDDVVFDLGNSIEYNREDLGTEGILKISTTKSTNTVYVTQESNPAKLKKKRRTDYSFAQDIEEKLKIDLREVIESYMELNGVFGHFNRYGVFEKKKISSYDGLYPSNNLYPSYKLYPRSATNRLTPSSYIKAWYDDELTPPIKAISATYKDTNNEESYAEYHVTDTQFSDVVLEEKTLSIQTVQGVKSSYIDWMSVGKTGPFEAGADIVFESTVPISSIELEYKDEFDVTEEVGVAKFPPSTRFVITKADNPNLIENADKILYITFKYGNTQETTSTIKCIDILEEPVIYEGDYSVYDISENYFIKEGNFTEDEILNILENVSENIRDISYMPCEVNCLGLPYLEAGDWITVVTKDYGFNSVILNRNMKGIQVIKDTFESKGE